MSLEFYYGFNVIMISRWIYTFRDEPISLRQCSYVTSLCFLSFLVYVKDPMRVWLALSVGLANILFYGLEKWCKKGVAGLRILSLLVSLLILNFFFSKEIGLEFNSFVFDWIPNHKDFLFVLESANKQKLLRWGILLTGALLIANEVNIGIRFCFQKLNIEPKQKSDKKGTGQVLANFKVEDGFFYLFQDFAEETKEKSGSTEISEGDDNLTGQERKNRSLVDKEEYNTGRVIGILERLLIYIFVLGNQYLAIGLILTAKGLARIKELEERQSAEYILIGTLLSTLLAVVMAVLIKSLLPGELG